MWARIWTGVRVVLEACRSPELGCVSHGLAAAVRERGHGVAEEAPRVFELGASALVLVIV